MNGILSVQRKEKGSKTKSLVFCLKVVNLYNSGMGGVDLMDQHTVAYLLDRKSSVIFYLRIIFDLIDIACVNSYLIYNMKHPNKLSLLDYKIVVKKNLIQYHQGRKRAVPMSRPSKRKNQPESIDNHGLIAIMLSKGKKLFPKASHLGVHIIYTLYIFAKTLWFFVWFLYISTASLSFLYIQFSTYIYCFFSVLCFERPKVVKEM